MNNNNNSLPKFNLINKPAFTIIEVIIVLVIGAVIMLAVFLVVPQLQRTQRNTNRQNAARRVITAAEQYKASYGVYPYTVTSTVNCSGTLATSSTCKPITDITGNIDTPTSGTQYTIQTTATISNVNNMYIVDNTTATSGCNTSGKLVSSGAIAGKFAVAIAQETASSQTGDTFCLSYP